MARSLAVLASPVLFFVPTLLKNCTATLDRGRGSLLTLVKSILLCERMELTLPDLALIDKLTHQTR